MHYISKTYSILTLIFFCISVYPMDKKNGESYSKNIQKAFQYINLAPKNLELKLKKMDRISRLPDEIKSEITFWAMKKTAEENDDPTAPLKQVANLSLVSKRWNKCVTNELQSPAFQKDCEENNICLKLALVFYPISYDLEETKKLQKNGILSHNELERQGLFSLSRCKIPELNDNVICYYIDPKKISRDPQYNDIFRQGVQRYLGIWVNPKKTICYDGYLRYMPFNEDKDRRELYNFSQMTLHRFIQQNNKKNDLENIMRFQEARFGDDDYQWPTLGKINACLIVTKRGNYNLDDDYSPEIALPSHIPASRIVKKVPSSFPVENDKRTGIILHTEHAGFEYVWA